MNIIDSLSETLKERVRSPFIGTLLLSWCAYNWKPIAFFLFSSKEPEIRINYIESIYPFTWTSIIYPFVFALIITLILPYLLWGLDRLIKLAKKGRKYEVIDLINAEQLRKDNSKLDNKIKSLELNIRNLEIENENLNLKNSKSNSIIEKLNEEASNNVMIPISLEEKKEYEQEFNKTRKSEISIPFGELYLAFVDRDFFAGLDEGEIQNLIDLGMIYLVENSKDKDLPFRLTVKGGYFLQLFMQLPAGEKIKERKRRAASSVRRKRSNNDQD